MKILTVKGRRKFLSERSTLRGPLLVVINSFQKNRLMGLPPMKVIMKRRRRVILIRLVRVNITRRFLRAVFTRFTLLISGQRVLVNRFVLQKRIFAAHRRRNVRFVRRLKLPRKLQNFAGRLRRQKSVIRVRRRVARKSLVSGLPLVLRRVVLKMIKKFARNLLVLLVTSSFPLR